MKKYLSFILLILGVFIVACSEDSNPVSGDDTQATFSMTIDMVLVEADTFSMGNGLDSNAYPVHKVTIGNDFYISKYELTNEEAVKVFNQAKKKNISGLSFSATSVSYNGKEILDLDCDWGQIGFANDSLYVKDNKEKYPAVGFSWYGARDFAVIMNILLSTDKYRLPTEAEWEFAARGGKKSNNYIYSGSNTKSDVAWCDSTTNGSNKVGSKNANELGIYDMSGNVWEWCSDWYGKYSSDSQTDPTGASSGSNKVIRSGAWNVTEYCSRAFCRSGYSPSDTLYGATGIRLVRSK